MFEYGGLELGNDIAAYKLVKNTLVVQDLLRQKAYITITKIKRRKVRNRSALTQHGKLKFQRIRANRPHYVPLMATMARLRVPN
jgi:hypothetical protein